MKLAAQLQSDDLDKFDIALLAFDEMDGPPPIVNTGTQLMDETPSEDGIPKTWDCNELYHAMLQYLKYADPRLIFKGTTLDDWNVFLEDPVYPNEQEFSAANWPLIDNPVLDSLEAQDDYMVGLRFKIDGFLQTERGRIVASSLNAQMHMLLEISDFFQGDPPEGLEDKIIEWVLRVKKAFPVKKEPEFQFRMVSKLGSKGEVIEQPEITLPVSTDGLNLMFALYQCSNHHMKEGGWYWYMVDQQLDQKKLVKLETTPDYEKIRKRIIDGKGEFKIVMIHEIELELHKKKIEWVKRFDGMKLRKFHPGLCRNPNLDPDDENPTPESLEYPFPDIDLPYEEALTYFEDETGDEWPVGLLEEIDKLLDGVEL